MFVISIFGIDFIIYISSSQTTFLTNLIQSKNKCATLEFILYTSMITLLRESDAVVCVCYLKNTNVIKLLISSINYTLFRKIYIYMYSEVSYVHPVFVSKNNREEIQCLNRA